MNDERAQEALRHLQSAAVELVAAARATLDVIDDLVRDPSALQDLLATVQHAAQTATGGGGEPGGHDPAGAPSDGDRQAPSKVTRIEVS